MTNTTTTATGFSITEGMTAETIAAEIFKLVGSEKPLFEDNVNALAHFELKSELVHNPHPHNIVESMCALVPDSSYIKNNPSNAAEFANYLRHNTDLATQYIKAVNAIACALDIFVNVILQKCRSDMHVTVGIPQGINAMKVCEALQRLGFQTENVSPRERTVSVSWHK